MQRHSILFEALKAASKNKKMAILYHAFRESRSNMRKYIDYSW